MTRIIAGEAGGRRLAVPDGRSTRPTSDRTREGLFSSLVATFGSLAGLAVLDLYAGSGAVGLEALSRGAAEVLLIESDARAAQVIKRNIAVVDLPGARVVRDRVDRALRRGPGEGRPAQLVFADPPYSVGNAELTEMLVELASQGWLAGDAVAVIERDARSAAICWPPGYAEDRSRRYGESVLWYGRASGDTPVAAASI
ncbi:MAG TPA: 16S rRNA (guanine(966)-N(2))-methyltransferase RsmD [Streptosporangiaceae bacterium]